MTSRCSSCSPGEAGSQPLTPHPLQSYAISGSQGCTRPTHLCPQTSMLLALLPCHPLCFHTARSLPTLPTLHPCYPPSVSTACPSSTLPCSQVHSLVEASSAGPEQGGLPQANPAPVMNQLRQSGMNKGNTIILNTSGFHSSEVPRVIKFIETESRQVGARV